MINKAKAIDLLERAVLVLVFLVYPFIGVLGAPWAWFVSRREWGFSTWDEWKDFWKAYSLEGLRELRAILIAPLRSS